MDISLTLQECELLLNIVEEVMDELQTEIHDTDNRDFRTQLRAKEQTLRGVIQKLEHAILPAEA